MRHRSHRHLPTWRTLACGVVLTLGTAHALAQDAEEPLPPELGNDDVTILEGESRTIYEYRQNGQLRLIRVVPALGRPYFLVPADPTRGYGDLEQRGQLVPSWRILEF